MQSPPIPVTDDWIENADWDKGASGSPKQKSAQTPVVSMTKEDKAAEMARRKEERKQVNISALDTNSF
jgi:hypothetical protein